MRRVGFLTAVVCLGLACGDGERDRPEVTEGFGVRLDEAQIQAEIQGSSMQVSFELELLAATSLYGTLTVELLKVGSDTVLSKGSTGFLLDAKRRFSVALEAPKVSAPGDLGGYVLRYLVELPDGSLYGRRSLYMAARRYELVVLGNNRFAAGEKGVLRVVTVHPQTGAGVQGIKVKISFAPDDNSLPDRVLDEGTTDALGEFSGSFTLSKQEVGGGTITVEAGSLSSSHKVLVEQERQILLTTDKPLYQPGQTVHVRALAMRQPRLGPVAGEKLLLEIEDPDGNKLHKQDTTSDSYGLASLRFELARLLKLGEYRVRVTMGSTVREKTFRVEKYVLPKFKVSVTTDKTFYQPGETIGGTVQADYFFNKPVQGDVKLTATQTSTGTLSTEVQGKTDASGSFAFKVVVPGVGGGVLLEAVVTDPAGAEAAGKATVMLSVDGALVQVVPDRPTAATGDALTVFVLATDPGGKPLAGQAILGGAVSGSATLDSTGVAAIQAKVGQCGAITASFKGQSASASGQAALGCGEQVVRLDADRALYQAGETAKITVRAPATVASATLDVLQGNASVASLPVKLTDGKGTVDLALIGDLRRTLELRAHALVGHATYADRRLIYVQGADQLAVKVTADKQQYRPAESAKLTLQVTDMQGKAAPGVLGVQVVDEALYALTEFKPGLERRVFLLDAEVIDAGDRLQFVSPEVLLAASPSAADQARAGMLFAAAGQQASYPIDYRSGDTTLPAAVAASHAGILAALQRMRSDLLVRFGYALVPPTEVELTAWCKSWIDGRIDDFGQAYRITTSSSGASILSAGMDESWGTADDLSGYLSFSIIKGTEPIPLPAADGGAYADAGYWPAPDALAASDGAAPPPGDAALHDGGGAAPKIREEFPETLYVDPALITDSQGKATIDLGLADSITTWRLSAIAHTKAGQLGSAAAGITVFQEFFVDTLLPTHLLQNDEVELPVAIYNYLGTAQQVTVTVKTESWFTLLEPGQKTVTVPAKSVSSATFRIRADKVGTHAFTATGVSATESDGVKRTVEVLPDGERQEIVFSGVLKPGTTSHTVTIPTAAIDGASELLVRVFPGLLAEVVHGFEALLQQPYGCFEQTSSTTYPNVMVLQYLAGAGLSTPQLEQQAKGYIDDGYQRLVSYEVPGGGFSLYGDPPAVLFLTAFGLMEFSDMAKVRFVDPSLIARTQSWLVGQQQADGSFPASSAGYYGSPDPAEAAQLTAYVAWALAHSGYKGGALSSALSYVKANTSTFNDSYTLGLAANALLEADPTGAEGKALLAQLKAKAIVSGEAAHWSSSAVSLAHSYGTSMEIETTALAAGALLLAKDSGPLTKQALAYLAGSKSALGSYGNTQATVLALRALLLALQNQGGDQATGTIQVAHNGAVQASATVSPGTSDVTRLFDLKQVVLEGDNQVSIDFVGTGELAYQVVGIYYLPHGSVTGQGPLSFAVSYDKTTLKLAEMIQVTATVSNTGPGLIPTVLMRIGLPPGFTVDLDDLSPAKTGGVVQNAELIAPHLVLYLGAVSTPQSASFPMTASLAGTFKAPPSVAYPYYTPEFEQIVDTPVVTVTAQ